MNNKFSSLNKKPVNNIDNINQNTNVGQNTNIKSSLNKKQDFKRSFDKSIDHVESSQVITSVITTYVDLVNNNKNKNVEIELEISLYKINQSIYLNIYKHILANSSFKLVSITRILDLLVDNLYNDVNPTTYRRSIQFSTEGKISEQYVKKQSVMKRATIIKDVIDYKLKVSTEEKVKAFTAPMNALVRIKIRSSFIHNDYPNWRFDLTMIKSGLLSELGPFLTKYKEEILMASFDEKNIFDKINLHEFNMWEVEMEWIGKELPVVENISIINILFQLINLKHVKNMKIQEYIYEVAKEVEPNTYKQKLYKTEWGLKRLLNQVIGLTKQSYKHIFPPYGMYVTEKTDGFRCLIIIAGNKLILLFKDTMIEKKLLIDDNISNAITSIFDSEILLNSSHNSEILLKIFDVIKYKNESIMDMPGRQRLEYLDRALEEVNKFILVKDINDENINNDTVINNDNNNIKIKATIKKFELITEENIDSIFKSTYEKSPIVEREGLIIMSGISPYIRTKNYKWKDFNHNTIDFLIKKAPVNPMFATKPNKQLYLLFVGINSDMMRYMNINKLPMYDQLFSLHGKNNYQPIQFTPSSYPLAYLYYHDADATDYNGLVNGPIEDNTIIELRIDHKLDKISYNKPLDWKFVQIRTDRTATEFYFGNDFEIAESTFQNYISPFQLDDLAKPDFGYFAENKSNIHEASNKFKRFIGTEIILKYAENSKWILDLGGGRGADLQRYQAAKVKNILFIDVDAEAINELILRKYSTLKSDVIMIKGKPVSASDISSTIYTLLMDLNQSYSLTAESINYITGNNKPIMEFVMSNFSFHYLCCTSDNYLMNIIGLLKTQVAEKGIIAITIMDGVKIFDRLKTIKQGEYYKIIENGVEKYSLKKNYAGTTIAKYGQTISVKLPFSNEHYDEALVNIPVVIDAFAKAGFEEIENYEFKSKIAAFKKINKTNYSSLTSQDLEYIDLFRALVFKRK